jgi:catechol 2,3-dioxygenase
VETRRESRGEQERIHPETAIGRACLVTGQADVLSAFYRQRIGLRELGSRDGLLMGAGERALLVLQQNPEARRAQGEAGLFHLALRLPDRPALAAALRRLLDTGTALEGFADHLVSEAVYLRDPEGNGIELYCDRPREAWFAGGALRMDTLPLDVEGLLAELPSGGGSAAALPPQTVMGHVHLRVSDLGATERFYTEALGFQLMLRFGSQAGFVSAGGYHHHVGFNTWGGPFAPRSEGPGFEEASGAPAAGQPDARQPAGLGYFSIRVPDERELERTAGRLRGRGAGVEAEAGRISVRDPSGIRVLVEAD